MTLAEPTVLAAACKALPARSAVTDERCWQVEGVAGTPAVMLRYAPREPTRVTLTGAPPPEWRGDPDARLVWIRFTNSSSPRELTVHF